MCEQLASAEDQLLLLHIKRIEVARLQLLQQPNIVLESDKEQNGMSRGWLLGFTLISFDVLSSDTYYCFPW